jgi:hypothetical protein
MGLLGFVQVGLSLQSSYLRLLRTWEAPVRKLRKGKNIKNQQQNTKVLLSL